MKLRLKKKDARVVLDALTGHKTAAPEQDVRRVNLIDRITDRYPEFMTTAAPPRTTRTK